MHVDPSQQLHRAGLVLAADLFQHPGGQQLLLGWRLRLGWHCNVFLIRGRRESQNSFEGFERALIQRLKAENGFEGFGGCWQSGLAYQLRIGSLNRESRPRWRKTGKSDAAHWYARLNPDFHRSIRYQLSCKLLHIITTDCCSFDSPDVPKTRPPARHHDTTSAGAHTSLSKPDVKLSCSVKDPCILTAAPRGVQCIKLPGCSCNNVCIRNA